MERGKMPSTGRGGKSKAPQHPQDIFALGSKSTVVVNRDAEKRNIHKPSTSGVAERKRETSGFGTQPPAKRSRIGSPAEAVGGTSLDIDPVDLVPNVLQALDTHNSDKLLGLLTGSIRLLKSQRSKPDPILCMSMLYLTKIRPNMFAHDTVTQSLCTLLKREQGAAFKSKGNPLVFVLACNMLYAGHRESNNWPDTFIKVYIEDALNERWWVECSWCKCLVENIATAFNTKTPPAHLIPTDNTLGTMSPSGSGSPLMGSTDEDTDNTELEYSVFPRYSSSYELVEAMVLEAIKEQIQRRAAPDSIGKGFLKLLSATCGFPEIRMLSAVRLEGWLHSGKLWRSAQELLAYVCCNADACGPTAARDHEVLAQLARMRLKTKPLQAAYQACLREMVSDSPALLRSVVTHTIYNELSNVRSPNNMAVLAALIQAQPQLVPAAMAETYQELLMRPEEYLRPLRALTRECVRAARADAAALLPLARALAAPPAHEPGAEVRERAFASLADLLCLCAVVTAAHSKHVPEFRAQLCGVQAAALGWLLEVAVPVFRPPRHDYQLALNKVMFVEPADAYSKPDNWPPEAERALAYRLCCEAPLPQNTLLRLIFIGLSKDIPVSPAEVFELVEQVVKRACALPPDDNPLQVDKLELADYIFQLCQFNPPDNITLPPGYTAPALAITSLYWRGWILLTMLAAHNPHGFAERAAATYPTLRALIEMCITGKPSIEWTVSSAEAERAEAERAAVLQLETHLAAASNAKLPITEHNSRLLSQLTTLDPLGPARKPPQLMIETLQQASQQLRLGKLLCRQPALLLDLVERHGTRRAMPWLHQLLRHDQLELSVLPVQCLCEFLSSGGEAGKAGELAAHLRRTLHDSEEGARAVLHYYLQRLAHAHASTRASAARGLRLVLAPTDAAATATAAADWLTLLWELRHWAHVRTEVVALVRAACLVECEPAHVAAYVAFLQRHVADAPLADHTALVLDLAHVLMERVSVTAAMLPAPDMPSARAHTAHRTLHALTHILYTHMRQCLVSGETEGEVEGEAGWGAGERVTLQWAHGKRASVHVTVAHAHLKLLCYGPSAFDADQEMYSWLQSVWVGREAPHAAVGDAVGDAAEDVLLPDWLRLHLVRSARPALLETGLRALPAHKLALFIQTFGMPVASMSALLSALDACPENAVVRLGVERGYMAQLLRVQRARGAQGGEAFAAALRLQDPQYPPDDELFTEAPLPEEASDAWDVPVALPLQLDRVPALLDSIFAGANAFHGDVDTAFTQLIAAVTEESASAGPFVQCACAWLQRASLDAQAAAGLLQHSAHASCLLRALLSVPPACAHILRESAERLLRQYKCLSGPMVAVLLQLTVKSPRDRRDWTAPSIPPNATKEQLISVLESTTPRTLEAVGKAMIESCDTQLVLDVISELLDASQQGRYDTHFKCDPEGPQEAPHVLGARGLGCGLLLDWLAELQRETLGPQPHTQMRLMFHARGAAWRPLLVALVAHRASWRTLHACLADLLRPDSGRQQWAPTALLNFAETLIDSPRICQGRDKATPKHYTPEDTLRLSHKQLEVLVRYVVAECSEAEEAAGGGLCPDGLEAARRRVEARLPLVLRCCSTPHALVAGALAAREHPMLLLLLYMRVPRVAQLLRECEERPSPRPPLEPSQTLLAAAAPSPSATDRVSHTLLTALAALSQPHSHNKELNLKLSRLESGARSLWTRVHAAGARALPLAAALLRGARHHHNMLSAIEMLSSDTLFDSEEINGILECLLNMAASGGVSSSGALVHRVATLLRRYIAARPARAAQLLHAHRELIQSVPALSAVCAVWGESGPPASASPPPAALEALQRRLAPPDDLCWALQEVEAWGSRRGGAWGGPSAATALLRAAAPFAAAPQPHVRSAALALLPKLLPAVADTKPGLEVILECLDSPQPEITQSMLDKLPDLVVGLQEHASRILMRVFELGVKSRFPVEQCITKCVTTINLQRGC